MGAGLPVPVQHTSCRLNICTSNKFRAIFGSLQHYIAKNLLNPKLLYLSCLELP